MSQSMWRDGECHNLATLSQWMNGIIEGKQNLRGGLYIQSLKSCPDDSSATNAGAFHDQGLPVRILAVYNSNSCWCFVNES